jgi:2-polyprenyl-3-methyl-5-hydroxy-6-metoxy-1,4-benzoquinol methylase
VLDVGCGVGKTGSVLMQMGFARIVGLEIHAEAAQRAKNAYHEVLVLDVEKEKLPFGKGFFDCILYGDVLEHLKDPWKVLREHRDYLSDEGVIICSIPNIRYYKILLPLIFRGRWNYEDIGILDRSHLRFFTLKTIEDLLRDTGFKIISVIRKKRCGKFMRFLNHLVFDRLIDFLVPQYRIIGAKGDEI